MPPKPYSQETEGLICSLYKDGARIKDIAVRLGTSNKRIIAALDRGDVGRRHGHRISRYNIDRRFFSVIDSEPKAYWLGFIMADGCIHDNEIKLVLSIGDAGHLEKLKQSLGSDHIVRIKDNNGHTGAFLNISCPEMVADLATYGVVRAKTLSVRWPDNILSPLLPHFLRGFFDANGSWAVQHRNDRPRPSTTWALAANGHFLIEAQQYLVSVHNLPRTRLNQHNTSRESYNLRYNGIDEIRELHRIMYDNATVWLDRKREKIEQFLREVPRGTSL